MSDDKLSKDEAAYAQAVFAGQIEGKGACEYCGGFHLRNCRRVKVMEWHPDGTLRRVVFWPDGGWDDSEVIWPEDVFDEEELDDGRAAGGHADGAGAGSDGDARNVPVAD